MLILLTFIGFIDIHPGVQPTAYSSLHNDLNRHVYWTALTRAYLKVSFKHAEYTTATASAGYDIDIHSNVSYVIVFRAAIFAEAAGERDEHHRASPCSPAVPGAWHTTACHSLVQGQFARHTE